MLKNRYVAFGYASSQEGRQKAASLVPLQDKNEH
jgi:hypothetical protein